MLWDCGDLSPLGTSQFIGVNRRSLYGSCKIDSMRSWPHSPSRAVKESGCYFVTASTLHRAKLFNTAKKLELLHDLLLDKAEAFGWSLEAWAVFSNHYHFVAQSPTQDGDLSRFIKGVHGASARELNRIDGMAGRTVWFQYRDTRLSYPRSYLARVAYTHFNAVKHGLVQQPERYPYCSARWFAARADAAHYQTVLSMPVDGVKVADDFDV